MFADLVLIILLLLYCNRGVNKGLLPALIGPAAAFICVHIALLYLDLSDNIFMAFLLAVGGALVLTMAVSLVFRLWRRTVNKQYREYVFGPSRLAGAVVSTTWLGALTVTGLLIFSVIPSLGGLPKMFQGSVRESKICAWTEKHVLDRTPVVKKFMAVITLLRDTERLLNITETAEFENFLNDKNFQACLEDPAISRHMRDKNILALATDPKIARFVTDNVAMRKLSQLVKKIYMQKRSGPDEESFEDPLAPQPTPQP